MYIGLYEVRSRRDEVQSAAFGLFILLMVIACLSFALMNAGPIILGTELNTNGRVEYLCLGAGCENLTAMDW